MSTLLTQWWTDGKNPKNTELPRNTSVDQDEVDRFSEKAKLCNHTHHSHTDHLASLTRMKISFLKGCIHKTGVKGSLPMPTAAAAASEFATYQVLDMGCGSGNNAKALALLGAKVVAVDPSPQIIKINLEHQQKSEGNGTVEYRIGTAEQLAESVPPFRSSWCSWLWPFSSNCTPAISRVISSQGGSVGKESFDIVMATDVIEHVANPRLFLSSLDKLLKPGGLLMITAPNRTLFSRLSVIFMAERILKAIPMGTHTWLKFIKPDELSSFMKRSVIQRNWCAPSPLTPRCPEDESIYVSADYDEVGRRGEIFLPFIHKWIPVPFLAMHYMIAYKKKTFFN